ncbi:MAG: ATP-grasp domain-containing protein, partial [Bacillota bacterium]|nr:ATP-grasp domain-containing protein [Bacillota bacterium]
LNVIEKEKPLGVVVQFGGQTALNLAEPLARAGVTILGTSLDAIDAAEDRDRFDRLVVELGIEKPPGRAAFSLAEAEAIAAEIGYPVLVRPSYVLGGRAMEIVYNLEELRTYMASATQVSRRHPVLVDKYLFGTELEVDAVSDGRDVLIAGIMQHVERAGIHSGDSIAVYPPPDLSPEAAAWIQEYTIRLARALNVRGLLNIQFVLHGGKIYVLEVNPRASRTVPYLSKITGLPLIKIATRVMLGQTLREQGYGTGLWPPGRYVAVKVPVFSFGKLGGVDTGLGPEMKSTGEVMGIDADFPRALYKGLAGAGLVVPPGGTILATVADRDKPEAVALLKEFHALGFKIVATLGTARALEAAGVPVEAAVEKVEEGKNTILELLRSDAVQLVINTVSTGKNPEHSGFQLRRAAVEYNVPCLTSLDTARAVLAVLRAVRCQPLFGLVSLQDLAAANAPDSDYLRAKLG